MKCFHMKYVCLVLIWHHPLLFICLRKLERLRRTNAHTTQQLKHVTLQKTNTIPKLTMRKLELEF